MGHIGNGIEGQPHVCPEPPRTTQTANCTAGGVIPNVKRARSVLRLPRSARSEFSVQADKQGSGSPANVLVGTVRVHLNPRSSYSRRPTSSGHLTDIMSKRPNFLFILADDLVGMSHALGIVSWPSDAFCRASAISDAMAPRLTLRTSTRSRKKVSG
jgi:hypothetical protein